ncbi:exo-beta-N-acetylmuramidase NamZ domain-containing protein, partial [Salmonella enterica]|uniref:exo-beta-N-acetylmuramidase NamZ domain-containing protein n=1 Tax=Salmonella enterica TaxID=28901 RepID=UPI0035238A33
MSLQYGINTLLPQAAAYKGQRLALVTNDAALTMDGKPGRVALLQAGFNIVRLFAPEHGMARRGEDGAAQPNGTDALTGLPIISLYGNQLAPTADDLADIDAVLFD